MKDSKSKKSSAKAPEQPRKKPGLIARLRQRYGMTFVISLSVTISVLVGGVFLGTYSTFIIYEQKQRDVWAIMFLELERRGTQLQKKFAELDELSSKKPDKIYRIYGKKNKVEAVHGDTTKGLNLKEFGLKEPELRTEWTVLQQAGKTYFAKIASAKATSQMLNRKVVNGKHLWLWRMNFSQWMGQVMPGVSNTVYAITREGAVLYTNRRNINTGNVVKRRLVQKFIRNPVSQSQFEFENIHGESIYGFAQEIPRTNVVVFSETPVSTAMAKVNELVQNFAGIMALAILISLIVIYIPISRLVGTIGKLTRHAKLVASGNFEGAPLAVGVGELGILTNTFNIMRANLQQRDRAIEKLIERQKHKVRLEGELEIARAIQRNLLEDSELPDHAHTILSTTYVPAEECAGDWYTYFYDQENEEVISIVADVSGHGAGSSMFTAVIAAVTEQAKSANGRFDIQSYLQDVNNIIRRLGKGEWHVTILVARIMNKTEQIELVNCGHPPPCVVYPEEINLRSKMIQMPSMILGIDEEVMTASRVLPFKSRSQILMYTDGLNEARSAKGKQFGYKKIQNICKTANSSPLELLGQLQKEWNQHIGNQVAEDDLCMISLRAA